MTTNTIFISSLLILFLSCSKSKNSGPPISPTDLDPLFKYQWHLNNKGENGGIPGEDINVLPVWAQGNKGEGIFISVIDDGVEANHPDLVANFNFGFSFNFSNLSNDPTFPDSVHGTSVSGLIAARDNNFVGLKGVAPRAQIVGLNILADNNDSTINIQSALTHSSSVISVSNNSWGFADDTGQFSSAPGYWKQSLESGLTHGREKRGTVYVWAAGNGGRSTDNANYDGFANFYGVISVCAVGNDGVKATYSEPGASLWLCAPSMNGISEENCPTGITTTDRSGSQGLNKGTGSGDCGSTELSDANYTRLFNGTSAAAPIVSGGVALLLKANPQLNWREVKIILAQTARKNDPQDADWTLNEVGLPINHQYGFGVIDIAAAVNAAKNWHPIGPLIKTTFSSEVEGISLPNNSGQAIEKTLTIADSGIKKIEYIEITVNITHGDWGDLDIKLVRSYNGVVYSDQLATEHNCYQCSKTSCTREVECTVSSNTFTFGSSRHLGAPADGEWTLVVEDKTSGNSGTFDSWELTFYGE